MAGFNGRAQEATPTPAAPASAQIQNALLVVSAREGAGSGFVGRLGDVPYLISNAHVIAGASQLELKLLSGDPVPPGKGRLAIGHDVVAFDAPAGLMALEICPDVNKEVAINDEIVVYGNSQGASVVTEIKGKVLGLGPDVVEIDAPFVPGNSGSPVIHLKSGKVIGIASYAVTRKRDELSKDSTVPEVRRFAYRLDTIKTWQDLEWRSYQAEAALLQGITDFTDAYFEFWEDVEKRNGRIAMFSSPNSRIQRHVRNLQREVDRVKSKKEFDKAVTSFLWSLQGEARQEFLPNRPVPRYWYTNHEWKRQKEMREAISKELGKDVSERNTRTE